MTITWEIGRNLHLNIIYHEGYYHLWIIDIPLRERKNNEQRKGYSTTRYLKSEDMLILKPSFDNTTAFDHAVVANPRIEYLNGKWFMYYKARKYSLDNTPEGYETENGIATEDNLPGPYTKYKGNPISKGHSAYLKKYKEGLLYFNMSPQEIYWYYFKLAYGIWIQERQ